MVEIKSICKRHNKRDSKIEMCSRKNRKHCGKWRKCWLPAFSPFLNNVFKRLFSFSQQCFQKASFSRSFRVGIVWKGFNFTTKMQTCPNLQGFTDNNTHVIQIVWYYYHYFYGKKAFRKKGKKMLVTSNFSIPAMFSKELFLMVV